jgi:hypothetical protein
MCTSVIFARTCEHGENRVGVKICREDRPSRPDGGGRVQRAARPGAAALWDGHDRRCHRLCLSFAAADAAGAAPQRV